MKLVLGWAMVLAALTISCSADKDGLEPTALLGRWTWVSTENSTTTKYYEVYQTPEITGNSITHEYFEDKVLTIIKNDTLESRGKYELLGANRIKIYINSDTAQYQYNSKGNHLILEEWPEMNVKHSFVRPYY